MPALPWRGNSFEGVNAEDGVAAAFDASEKGDAAGGFDLRVFLHGPALGIEFDFEHVEFLAFHFDGLIQDNNPTGGFAAYACGMGEESADGERGSASLPCGRFLVVASGEGKCQSKQDENKCARAGHRDKTL